MNNNISKTFILPNLKYSIGGYFELFMKLNFCQKPKNMFWLYCKTLFSIQGKAGNDANF